MTSLPLPTPEQLAHSARVRRAIGGEIATAGGWIGFDRYMELALYAPGLGYYSAGLEKFGARGDFVTAPEISPLFGYALARQVAQVLREGGGDVLELGAGTGRLAVQILSELQRQEALPERYFIMEVSAHLRLVQQEMLQQEIPELATRVRWLDVLPSRLTGCVVANEVLDAMPVHLVVWRPEGLYERGISAEGDLLVWRERPLVAGALFDAARKLELPPGYASEICLAAPAWISSLADMLERGALLLIDYGFPRREYYHPQRSTGTLMCHYRHHAHDDPLLYPGLQDITAHVDFTAVAEAASAAGLQVRGYVTQAQFLMNSGITDLLSEVSPGNAAVYLPLVAQAQKLLSPAEMGELFKAILLSRGLVQPVLGFARGDKRHAL